QKSGVAHFWAADDADCIARIRRLLSFLPSNNLEEAPAGPAGDPLDRADDGLLAVVPVDANKPYDVRDVIHAVVDHGDFLEVHEQWATNIVVGLARIGQQTVGIIANQPRVLAGCL